MEQGGVDNDITLGLRHLPLDFRGDPGVRDGLQVAKRAGVGKYEAAQNRPLNGPETLQDGGAFGLQGLVSDAVSVHQNEPPFREEGRKGVFA